MSKQYIFLLTRCQDDARPPPARHLTHVSHAPGQTNDQTDELLVTDYNASLKTDAYNVSVTHTPIIKLVPAKGGNTLKVGR